MITETRWLQLVVALLCVIVAGTLTAAEAALRTISRSRAERLVEEARRGAQRLLRMAQDPPPFLNTTLFVRTAFEITAIVLVTLVVVDLVPTTWARLGWAVGSMVVVSFILLGVAPRTLGRQHADAIALRLSGLVSVMTTVLGPVSTVMIVIGNMVTPGRGFSDGPFSSEAELRELVDIAEASEVIEDAERKMIHSVFDLSDTIAKEVMVPRTEMVYIERTKTLRQGASLALRSGFSRIPVIGEDLDDVVGVLYLKDIIRRMYDNPAGQASETVDSLMRRPTFCPDSKPADALLREMQLTRSHVVIVVDEFGGTAGLVTIEDILEEIVGEIVDEFDHEVPPFVATGGGRYRVSARLSLDDLGDLFGLKLDDEDVDTVLGLMAKELNQVPIPGSVVHWGGLELVAERGTGRRATIQTVMAGPVAEGAELSDQAAEAAVQAAESALRGGEGGRRAGSPGDAHPEELP